YPEAIQIADDQLVHSVERIVRGFDDLHSILQPFVKFIHLVRVDIQINLAPEVGARCPALIEHYPAGAKGHDCKTQTATLVAVGINYLEANALIPDNSGPDIGHVNHWDDCINHNSSLRFFSCGSVSLLAWGTLHSSRETVPHAKPFSR